MIGKEGYFWDKNGKKVKGRLTSIRDGNVYKYVTGEVGYENFEALQEDSDMIGEIGYFWDGDHNIDINNYVVKIMIGRLERIEYGHEFPYIASSLGPYVNFSLINPLEQQKSE